MTLLRVAQHQAAVAMLPSVYRMDTRKKLEMLLDRTQDALPDAIRIKMTANTVKVSVTLLKHQSFLCLWLL